MVRVELPPVATCVGFFEGRFSVCLSVMKEEALVPRREHLEVDHGITTEEVI